MYKNIFLALCVSFHAISQCSDKLRKRLGEDKFNQLVTHFGGEESLAKLIASMGGYDGLLRHEEMIRQHYQAVSDLKTAAVTILTGKSGQNYLDTKIKSLRHKMATTNNIVERAELEAQLKVTINTRKNGYK